MNLPQTLIHRINAEVDPAFALRSRAIFEAVAMHKPQTVLDAGCGRGFYVTSCLEFPFIKNVVGIDINNGYIAMAKDYAKEHRDKRLKLSLGSIYELPYPKNSFDMVISSEVMEHVPDDGEALRELWRVTKPGGTLIITVPNAHYPFLWDPLNWLLERVAKTHVNKNIWWLAGIWADHERLYTLDQISAVTKKAGWAVVKAKSVVHYAWPFSHFLLYGVGKNIVERLGSKSFNRFTTTRKPLSELLAKFFAFPQQFDPIDMTGVSCVDLILELQKPHTKPRKL